ncbi:MAG: signal peptidase II [SAR86 cluster bacterium]|uniref:Lipoprotein signal peptidase n=1 Tax=SAR86 cluster bacterium TaxID=2030880 RepID=A0A2A4XII6_9GAMM|nr:MAG: signal peptidase II [SAR86 cluster bacterium]
MQLENKQTNMLWFVGIVLIVLALSQIIGYWVNTAIPQNTSVEWSSLIHFTHIRNHGGVFGMLQGMGGIFATISITLLIGVSAYLWFSPSIKRYEYICFGFIVGGGASNILDRFVYGSVIDFIDIQHIPYWNYIFNTADVMVHIGIWPLLFFSFLASTDETDSGNLH